MTMKKKKQFSQRFLTSLLLLFFNLGTTTGPVTINTGSAEHIKLSKEEKTKSRLKIHSWKLGGVEDLFL